MNPKRNTHPTTTSPSTHSSVLVAMVGIVTSRRVTVRNAPGVLTAAQTASAGASSRVERSTIIMALECE
jgi:hypothetical protein